VAQFGEGKVQELMQNAGIIRNQAKIRAAIKNAQVFLDIQKEWGSFDAYIRSFTDGKIIHNHLRSMQDYTPTTELSDRVSKDMKKR
jgi:3-methyladenine DNA glycosylase Tag